MAREKIRAKKKERKNIAAGVVHVNSSFNNTKILISDVQGNAIAWSSAGTMGFKGLDIPTQSSQLQRCGTAHGKTDTVNSFGVNIRGKVWISQHRIKGGADVPRPFPHVDAAA